MDGKSFLPLMVNRPKNIKYKWPDTFLIESSGRRETPDQVARLARLNHTLNGKGVDNFASHEEDDDDGERMPSSNEEDDVVRVDEDYDFEGGDSFPITEDVHYDGKRYD